MERSKSLSQPPSRQIEQRSPKRRMLAFFICLFFGGFHRFYVGKFWSGVLFLMTAGGLGIWWAIDLVTIAMGRFEDSEGRPLGPPRERRELETEPAPASDRSDERGDHAGRDGYLEGEGKPDNDWVVEDEAGEEVALDDEDLMGDPLEREFEELEEELEREKS